MTPQPVLPTYIDSTMLTCFRSCPEKFRLEFVYGLRPQGVSIDLHAGACFALGLETTYRQVWEANQPLDKALQVAHAAFMVAWGDVEVPDWKKTAKTKDRTWEAVEEYFKTYPPHTDSTKPYFVDKKPTFEYTFAIPLEPCGANRLTQFPAHPVTGDPFLYSGRFDMLGEYCGRPVVRDEKTAGQSASTGWSEKWDLRSQFIGYTWACRQCGLDLDTVIVRGVGILKLKFDFAEAIKIYSDHMRAIWLEQLRRDLWRIVDSWNEGYFDLNLGDTCTAYGNCMFMDICKSQHKESWMNQFEVRRWNPLLKNPTEGGPDHGPTA